MTKVLEQLKLLILAGILVLVANQIGYGVNAISAIPGMIVFIIICQVALIIRAATPKIHFPAFAWATMISLILSMPFMPTASWFLATTGSTQFLATTAPILAFAGISVGNKLHELGKMSWKIVIVAICVFIGTFFGSAIIAQIVLKMQGLI